MKTAFAFAGVISVALSNNRCEWLQWTESDWPLDDNQDFRPIMPINASQYLGFEDFNVSGRFYGRDWLDVFWGNPNFYRPLGFQRARIMPFNEKFPCFNVTGAGGHKVELMVYTLQANTPIAVTDISTDGIYKQDSAVVEQESVEKSYNCFTANTNVTSLLRVATYCNENCPESEIDILWRFRRSKMTWDEERETQSGNVDMWCNMIASKIYWPSDLTRGSPSDVDESANENLDNGAVSMTGLAAALVGFVAAMAN